MKNNKTKSKKVLFIVLIMLLFFFIVSGEGSWLIKSYITSDDGIVDSSQEYCNVYVKYVNTEMGEESKKDWTDSTTNSFGLSSMSVENLDRSVWKSYEEGYI